MTSAAEYASLFSALPDDIPSLCRIVQGLMIHVFWAGEYGVNLGRERRDELQAATGLSKAWTHP